MSEFLQIVATMREQMSATLSRSDVLKALIWPIGILVMAMLASVLAKSPAWLTIIIVVLLVASVVLYLGAYVFCLFVDRDALRSESYKLQKLALEQGVFGDNRIGLKKIADVPPRAISARPKSGGQDAS